MGGSEKGSGPYISNLIHPAFLSVNHTLSKGPRLKIHTLYNAQLHRNLAQTWLKRKCVCYDGLVVIGAESALETGQVDFLDGLDKME